MRAMGKRSREVDDEAVAEERPTKCARSSTDDLLSKLSDELILRVLAFLSVSQLAVCQRLSSKYYTLAGDSQIWKSHYYNRFVRPRASRLPGLKELDDSGHSLHFASKASRWLDDEHLVERGRKTNWKRQYKLRHNWTKGTCAVNEIPVAEEAAVPPVLVQMHDGIIYMADQTDGLRAWAAQGERKLIALRAFEKDHGPPTALAVDTQEYPGSVSTLLLGFQDGAFAMYVLDIDEGKFIPRYNQAASSNGVVSAVAVAYPYAVTMTATHLMSLYRFSREADTEILDPPRLLYSLKSHNVWPPLSTSLRKSERNITISLAYALPTYLSGWTVGIQEVKLDLAGKLLDSRLASAIDQHYRPLAFSLPPMMQHLPLPVSGSLATATMMEMRHIHSKPTSLSYTHPYLLVSHPDNTLTLYLVTSNAESLCISAGSRLWGHTSSVSGAHVAARGKAVSVSRRGDELRVWELEGGFASTAARKRLASGELSVQIRAEKRVVHEAAQAGLDLTSAASAAPDKTDDGTDDDGAAELTLTRGWIGFDDEQVVVLKERNGGRQALVVYDFT